MSESCPGVVLIVDNDISNVAGVRSELSALGYVVLEASDAPSALSHLNSHHVDIIITELRLPGGDGLQLIDHIRRACPDTRVIVATGQATVETAVEAMKRGSDDFLARPCAGSAAHSEGSRDFEPARWRRHHRPASRVGLGDGQPQ